MGQQDEGLVAVEIFAAKDAQGADGDLFLAVSRECGLRNADSLLLDGDRMVAMRAQSVLPIDFPPLSDSGRSRLLAWSEKGKPLPVAEFAARGVFDAYFLNLVVSA